MTDSEGLSYFAGLVFVAYVAELWVTTSCQLELRITSQVVCDLGAPYCMTLPLTECIVNDVLHALHIACDQVREVNFVEYLLD